MIYHTHYIFNLFLSDLDWVGDGFCDDALNFATYNFDGNDCCGGFTWYCTDCECKENVTGFTNTTTHRPTTAVTTPSIDRRYTSGITTTLQLSKQAIFLKYAYTQSILYLF